MKRILMILKRDWISTTRDAMLLYMVLAPLLIATGLRLFLPGVGQTAINVALPQNLATELAPQLEPYLKVEVLKDRQAVEQRVLAFDDTAGILPDPQGGYTLVLEGNESHDTRVLPEMVLQRITSQSSFNTTQVDLGGGNVLFREWAAAFLGFGVLFISAVAMAFHIVEDKESRMMHALGVTPLNSAAYILARSLFVLALSLLTVFGSLWALGVLAGVDLWMLLAVTLAGVPAGALFGFVVGAVSRNQIEAIAAMKFAFLVILLPAILALMIPETFQIALYWVPTYWVFTGFKAILVDNAGWSGLWLPVGLSLGITFAALLGSYPWLKRRLDFANN